MKKIIVSIIAVIVISNLITQSNYIRTSDYTYANFDNTFLFREESGGYSLQMAKTRYKWFLQDNPNKVKQDTTLYRTFTIKPWRFWQWGDYVFGFERFKLPYKDPSTNKPGE